MTDNSLPSEFALAVEEIWQKQLQSYDEGALISAEELLRQHPDILNHPESAVDVIFNEYELRRRDQDSGPSELEFLKRFPKFRTLLERQFRLLSAFESAESANESAHESTHDSAASETKYVPTESPRTQRSTLAGATFSDTSSSDARFRNRKIIGQGATATVESAFDEHLQQQVAIKRRHPHLCQSIRANRRFRQEAQTTAMLHHPHIVPLHEILEDNGELLLISRFINGTNLDELGKTDRPNDIEQFVTWARSISDALHYAHENGVIHRDVKPSNIIIDESGKALLADFGLASNSESHNGITQTGELIGTPAFMSPEQARGGMDKIDFRTDVYSLGATMYFLLAGRPPFEGNFAKVIKQVAENSPSPIHLNGNFVPKDLITIVNKCLEKVPSDRYQTARDVGDDLRRFQNGDVILAKQAGTIERCVKYVRRHPVVSTAIATTLLLTFFLLGTLLQLGQVRGQRNRAQLAEQNNRELLASASADAGRLAMQRGNPDLAVKHFRNSFEQGMKNPGEVHLALVDCYLTLGKVESAADQLELARAEEHKQNLDLILYWESELAAVGHPEYSDSIQSIDFSKIDLSKRHFLWGLNAATSIEALDHFRQSVDADPYHHSARRMYLIMALSLARFDEVLSGTRLARQIYPDDDDFRLIEACASAANGNASKAKDIVEKTDLQKVEREKWSDFCDFLCEMKSPVVRQDAIEKKHLQLVADLLSKFSTEFLPLLNSRRWRFPAKIGEKFSLIGKHGGDISSDLPELQEIAKTIVKVHPEATLLAIVAENELAGANPIEQLEYSRDRFLQATQSPSFVNTSIEGSWIGVYSTSMVLNVVHKHEKAKNRNYMIAAAKNIDPKWLTTTHTRVFVITLINIGQWDLAKPFVDHWIEFAADDKHKAGAYWHLAVWHRNQKNWSRVIETVDQFARVIDDDSKIGKKWRGLRADAVKQMQRVIGQ